MKLKQKLIRWVAVLCFAFLGLTACEKRATEEDRGQKSKTANEILTDLKGEEDDKDNIGQLEQLIVGEDYFLVLYDDGSVWSWGNNAEGKLGMAESFVSEPQRIEGLERVVKLEDGGSNVFALTEQGEVYTWGRKMGVVHTLPVDPYALLYEPWKLEDLREIVDITAENGNLYAVNAEGDLYASEVPWERNYFYSFSQVQNPELLGKIDRMFAGAGNYHYFLRTDGTVFSLMTFMYEGYNNAFAFIFPHIGDITFADEDILSFRTPEGLPDITILDEGGKDDCFIYYNLTGVDGINTMSADPYTVFLSKEDGTLCYWNSDRIKYHDLEWALTAPDTGREHCDGSFVEICVEDVLEMKSDAPGIPCVVSIQSGTENTMFLTEDGQVFISRYETYEVTDVDYGIWSNPDPGRLPDVNTTKDAQLKELMFQKLELTDIESIWTNGESCFCAVDREGGYYRIELNDNEVTQVYQGLILSDRLFRQETIQPETISPETIFINDNVIDLGNHIVAYYLPNNEDFSSSYGYYAKDFMGDRYIAIHNIDQNEIFYFPDIYEDIAEIKMVDSGELYIQYTDHNSNKKEEVHIPVTFSDRIGDDHIDIMSFDNHCGKLIISSQEGLQSGEAAFSQTVWTETFSFEKQMYEVTFERLSPVYDLGLITGGLYADYCLTVRDEKEDVVEKITIINYPIVYEEVHWLIDLSEDGFADIVFAFSDDWGMDTLSGQTSLLTLIWNQEMRTYEKTIFPWSWQDQDGVNYCWSHPMWNKELSSLISFVGNDKYGTFIMDMYSFLDGRWRRVRRLKAYYDENESPDLDNPVNLGYYELTYSADGNVVEETAIDCESGAPWFDEESVWSGKNAGNLKLYPEYPQWVGDYSNVGGIEVCKYTESLYEADDKPAVHITEEPMNDECINIRTVKLEKSTEEDTVMIQYPYLTDENEISRRINEQIYNLLVPEGIEGNDGWADRADITFEITYVDDKVLSIYFTGYRDKGMSANGGNFDMGLNFDLSTGELLCLSDFYTLSEIRDLLNDAITEDKLSIVNVPLSENEFAEYVTNIFLKSFEPDRKYINETNNFFIKEGKLCFLAEPYPSLAELTCIEMEIKVFP